MIDPYDLALIVLGVLLVLIAIVLLVRRIWGKGSSAPAYELRPEFLSHQELTLVPLIEEAFGDFRVLFRTPLETVIQPTASSARKRRRAIESLKGRTVPILLCRRADFTPVGAIVPGDEENVLFAELDACGIVVLHVSATALPAPQELRAEFDRRSSGDEAQDVEIAGEEDEEWRIGTQLPRSEEEEGRWLDGISPQAPVRESKERENKEVEEKGDAQLFCPQCGLAMTRRRMVRGPHAGRDIWVCSNFPTCRKTVPVLPERP